MNTKFLGPMVKDSKISWGLVSSAATIGCSIVVCRWPRKVSAFTNLCMYIILWKKKCSTGPVANGKWVHLKWYNASHTIYHIMQFPSSVFTFCHLSPLERTWFHCKRIFLSLSQRLWECELFFSYFLKVCDMWSILSFSFGRVLESKPAS